MVRSVQVTLGAANGILHAQPAAVVGRGMKRPRLIAKRSMPSSTSQ
jgi:hypothetical protein